MVPSSGNDMPPQMARWAEMSSEKPSLPVWTSFTVIASTPLAMSDLAMRPVATVLPIPVSIPDMKYILSDSGTATCGRLVEVYDAETEKCIFGANYYMEVEYSDGKIVWTEPEVHYVYGKNLDAEIADFVANTPVPDDLKNYPANLVVRKFYEHNLVTGEDKFIGYRYAFEE